ncbi:MAG: tetratricopeptide repeat protein [Flavobacteriaceae bacterium]|nr:tetratricopeptide repeat protein [Flavobacteriaceae bacterium]
MSYSQKKELRDASKEIKNGSFEQAKKILASIENQINSADNDQKAEFYLYKGQAYLGAAGNKQEDLMTSVDAFKKVSEIESTGKQKYTKEAEDEIQALLVRLVNSAIQDQNAQKYSDASKKLYASYTISKVDTAYLYFAATNAMNAQEYVLAMNYYENLLNLGYTGIEKEYVATHKETGEVDTFADKEEQNLYMMSGDYVRPQERMSESRRPVILRDLGVLYVENGKIEEAKELISNARKDDPNDVSLIKAEANIALQMNDMKKYNELMQQVVASDPDNPELFYNLGVSASEIGDNENAINYYKRALELDPNYVNAQVNMAVLILDQEQALIEEMNSLGTSAKDNKRYDELISQRNNMYNEAVPYLESALKARPNDANILRTLMNIYSILGEDAKYKEMKSRIEANEE